MTPQLQFQVKNGYLTYNGENYANLKPMDKLNFRQILRSFGLFPTPCYTIDPNNPVFNQPLCEVMFDAMGNERTFKN
jgi:hypothetical protein